MSKSKRKIFELDSDADEEFSVGRSPQKIAHKSKKSQAKSINSFDQRSSKAQKELNIFEELVEKVGLILSYNEQPNELKSDQVIFQRELQKQLKCQINYPRVIDEFIEAFYKHIADDIRLKTCLAPTLTASDCESARGNNQDTLVRILLGVEIIQTPLIARLLEKATECALLQNGASTGEMTSTATSNLIICQLRWLGKLVDGKALADKMLEMLEILPLDNQRQMIRFSPDFLNDSDHPEVAKKLCNMLLENTEVSVAIVEALSQFSIQSEALIEVKHNVLKMIQSAKLEELPTLIKFVLRKLDPLEAPLVIQDLRTKINLSTPIIPNSRSTPLPKSQLSKVDRSFEVIVMNTILYAFDCQKVVFDFWIKTIDLVESSDQHNPLDILVLLALHTNPSHQKLVETFLKNKIKNGRFKESLFKTTIFGHVNVLNEYFDSIHKISESFLRSPEPILCAFGQSLYQFTFEALSRHYKHHLIHGLVTLAISDSIIEVNASLDTLTALVKDQPIMMAPFGSFLKSLLDRLECMTLNQVRKVYFLLNHLVYHGGREGALIEDELNIVIRKQLMHTQIMFQRIGIMGAITAAKAMAGNNSINRSSLNNSSFNCVPVKKLNPRRSHVSLNETISKNATELLQRAQQGTQKKPEVLALYYDELARAFLKGELDNIVEKWLNEVLAVNFENEYVVDYDPENVQSYSIPTQLMFNLDPFDLSSIVLDLVPVILIEERLKIAITLKEYTPEMNHISALTMLGKFRLLRIASYFLNKESLEEIDALLVCAVKMPLNYNSDNFSTLPQEEKQIICTSTFYCLNWFREIINAFVTDTKKECRIKVVQRLKNVVEMQEKLKSFLAETPNFVPPLSSFDSVNATVPQIVSGNSKTRKPKAPFKRGRKRAASEATTQSDLTLKETQAELGTLATPANTKKASQASSDVSKSGVVNLGLYRAFFREIDLCTFTLLENGVLLKDFEEIEDSEILEDSKLKLGPNELLFLLEDLITKLECILPVSATKRLTVFQAKNTNKEAGHSNLFLYTPLEVASSMVLMLPIFCSILEECSAYFQSLVEKNDGIIDGPGSENTETISNCMLALLRIINTLFSWNGFSTLSNQELLEKAISFLSTRLNLSDDAEPGLNEHFRCAFRYLAKFDASLPSLTCAVALVRLLETLAVSCEDSTLVEQTSEMAEMFLQRSWTSELEIKDKGAKHNENVNKLLRSYLVHAKNTLTCLNTLTMGPVKEVVSDESKQAESNDFPTLNVSTFPTYYRAILSNLVRHMKTVVSVKEKPSPAVRDKKVMTWITAVNIFVELVGFVKRFDGRQNLSSCLKNSTPFLDHFLKHCMPLLDQTLRLKKDEVLKLLKHLQQGTRMLQNICSHTKVIKDVNLVNCVPALKKSLESIVYRVKYMLVVNKCENAFWLGNLKNRDIHGEEILSQQSAETEPVQSEPDVSTEGNESEDY